jgi:hypothetical protein
MGAALRLSVTVPASGTVRCEASDLIRTFIQGILAVAG